MLNTDIVNTVIAQDTLGCFRTGDPSAGKLVGITLKGVVNIGACPQRKNHAGQNCDKEA